jgi:hypothetical protein
LKNILIVSVVVAVIATGAGFFGGMTYQKSQVPTGTARMANFAGPGGQGITRTGTGANRNSFRPVTGEITSADDTSITVRLTDGSSKIVLVGASSQINKASIATKSDLAVGQTVMVVGTQNTDGSVTAESIQLNPQIRAFPRPTGQ